jgi:F-type H+-transporting ATPase subunit O
MLLTAATCTASAAPGLGRCAASAIALKYSKAVCGTALAKSPQILTKVQSKLNSVSSTIKNVPELSTFMHNPALPSKDCAKGLAPLLTSLEAKKEPVPAITKNLLTVLSENGRLG